MTQRGRMIVFWTTLVVVASFVVGLWMALERIGQPGIQRWFKPSMGAVMIVAGLFLLTPFAIKPPVDDLQRQHRRRLSFFASGLIVYGVAVIVPNLILSVALMGVQLVLMAVAATGKPRRLFTTPVR